MKQINIIFIVLEVGKPTTTKDGHTIRRVKVADKTGSIDMSVWDEYGAAMQAGDICKIIKGYASMWKDSLTLYSGKVGEIQRIDDFCMTFVENPNMSEPNSELAKQQQQRMNGGAGPGPGGGGGSGGPSQEQQPPSEDNGQQQSQQQQRSNNVNRSADPRSGAGGKMTQRNGQNNNNNSGGGGGGGGSTQNNAGRPHHQHHHHNKPYPPKKPLGSQNSLIVSGANAQTSNKDGGATPAAPQHQPHPHQQLQGILKR